MGKEQELLEAARSGYVAIVEKILGQRAKRSGPLASLRRGPGANVQDSSGYTSLHHAALNGHREIVRLLLDHDASTNIVDIKGSSPLHLAAWSGNTEIVKLLLTGHSPCNVNLTTKDDETALHCAAQYGHTGVVALLLERGCDPGIRNSRGETALDLAAQYGRIDAVELLVRTHPSLIETMQHVLPGTVFPHTPLHLASRNGHKAVVEILLRAGLDVNIRSPAGTALHEAALCGKLEVVRTLLENGADLSIRDSHNFTVKDLLSQFPAQATHDIMGLLKKFRKHHRNNHHVIESDAESISHPFPPVPTVDSDLGSPYENVRPSSRGKSLTVELSPGTSPHRWDFHRQAISVDGLEDRRISGTSMRRSSSKSVKLTTLHEENVRKGHDSLTFKFSEAIFYYGISSDDINTSSSDTSSGSYRTAYDCSRESETSFGHIPIVPKPFMDISTHSEESQYLSSSNNRDIDRISLSSTTSSTGYSRRPESGGTPLYMPMNKNSAGHSPGSNNSKVSPTPPKKPPRRNLSVSPTHMQPMSSSVDGFSNNAYEYIFLAQSGTRSQSNLNDIEHETRRERLLHGRSMDQYVEMNAVFNIPLDEEDGNTSRHNRELLQRGKSEDLDCRKREPTAITTRYENTIIKQQNPRRKLRRNVQDYEEYDFRSNSISSGSSCNNKKEEKCCSSSAPAATFVSSAFIMIKDDYSNDEKKDEKLPPTVLANMPLSPTHYQQPPTPDHPPPSALQAENFIHDKIRPLSQECKRRSKDMETETEEEYLLICDGSSGSFSSSVSLSDRSVDNIIEEYQSDATFAGLIKGSSTKGTIDLQSSNTLVPSKSIPAERPKTLKKLKRVYDNNTTTTTTTNGTTTDNSIISSITKNENKKITQINSSSSNSDKESSSDNKVSALSPFDEQEEWAKIQEIMASFGTGIVRESVFVTELEKEFQSRLMSLSCSQNSLDTHDITTIDKWLHKLDMDDYFGLFIASGFDDVEFLNGVLEEQDLKEMGIQSELERQIILDSIKELPLKISEQSRYFNSNNNNNNNVNEQQQQQENTVDNWLSRIHLSHYSETFSKHLYLDMERIKRIWDVELSAVLDIEKVGHRKRILASVSSGEHIATGPKLEDISADISILKNNIQQINTDMRSPASTAATTPTGQTSNITNVSNTGTIRHRHKKSRPAPPPPVTVTKPDDEKRNESEMYVGGSNSIKAQWRHQPILLITGSVKYNVNYLGSTLVKEFKGTESTKKSLQKIRKTEQISQEITLAISYRGLKYINPQTQETICEHEIRNVNCACQDPEHRGYFAYITKDNDDHFCHIFSTNTADQATDVILTLGQAFELAYQMALREQVTSKSKSNKQYNTGTTSSTTTTTIISPGSISSHSRDFKDQTTTIITSTGISGTTTSSRTTDLKLNGHPLKMKPLTLSIAADKIGDNNHHYQRETTPTTKVNNTSDIEA